MTPAARQILHDLRSSAGVLIGAAEIMRTDTEPKVREACVAMVDRHGKKILDFLDAIAADEVSGGGHSLISLLETLTEVERTDMGPRFTFAKDNPQMSLLDILSMLRNSSIKAGLFDKAEGID